METKKKISVLLETIVDDEIHKVSLRVNFLLSDSNTQPTITKDTVIGLLEQRGFSQYRRLDEQISAAIEDIKQKLADLESSSEPANETFETPVVAIAVDAKAEVKIAADSLEGFITLTPAKGGKQLKLAEVKSILSENGVKFGIEDQLLVDLLQQAQQSKTGKPIEKLVARAKQPVNGDDTQFIPLVDTANERVLKPQLRPDGTIDLRELGNLPMVHAGHKIMRRELFTMGEPGVDVRGHSIEANPGQDFDFTEAPGSNVNKENPLELLAEISGQPNLVFNGMKVDNVIKLKAVDLSTGNLDIDANLLVEGDITESMKVKCTGDITVGGVIESAEVEAKGSVFVGKGIVGHMPHHEPGEIKELTTFVRAGNSINALFASYSKLQAKSLIHIDEQMLHCNATSQDMISVGSEQVGRGKILGGITRAGITIEVDIIGSSAGILTRLDLSGSHQKHLESLADIEQDLSTKQKQVKVLNENYSQLTRQKLTSDQQTQADKIKNTIVKFNKVIGQLESGRQAIKETIKLELNNVQLRVKRRIHSPIEVQIGPFKFKARRTMESGVISLVDDDISFHAENLIRDRKSRARSSVNGLQSQTYPNEPHV
ncbi:MAG: DUF342 domain-containing protein [Candidatus Reddybacter sp.]